MRNSKIKIIFMSIPLLDSELIIKEKKTGLVIKEVFKTVRSGTLECSIPRYESAIPGIKPARYYGNIATNYQTAINLDYNYNSKYNVIATLYEDIPFSGIGTVTIEANYENAEFVVEKSPVGIDTEIENSFVLPVFDIEKCVFSPSVTNKCTNVLATITTTESINTISVPFPINLITNKIISFEVPRGIFFEVNATSNYDQKIKKQFNSPIALVDAVFEIKINTSPFGSTITIINTVSNTLRTEYSIDNISWVSTNEFSGLASGSYTLYIKDEYGCVISKAFKIDNNTYVNPYFYISKSNAIRYAKRENTPYKTDENTLSCEANVELAYTETQEFLSTDKITTQFKSNYANNNVSIIIDGNITGTIPVVKRTKNIGLTDKRDAKIFNLGNGKTGVYFTTGNIYDHQTGFIVNSYSLSGELPEWAVINNYFSIGSSYYLIEDVIFDDIRNAKVIVFYNTYNKQEETIKVASIYNRFNYEVYEFNIDMSNYEHKELRVNIESYDTPLSKTVYLSERLTSNKTLNKLLEIRYRNTSNTDVYYATGIEYVIRVPYIKIKGKTDEDSETHKTDTAISLLKSNIFEINEFEFEPLTKEMWRKLIIALSHEVVFIDSVGYVKSGSFNADGPLDNSNLYTLTASMLKTGNTYSSKSSSNILIDSATVEIPNLISTETGLVRY